VCGDGVLSLIEPDREEISPKRFDVTVMEIRCSLNCVSPREFYFGKDVYTRAILDLNHGLLQ
jgi:hypothetical protein